MIKIKLVFAMALAVFLWFNLHTASARQTTGGLSIPGPKIKKAKLVGAKLLPPSHAPKRIKMVIRAANRITKKPYIYGGGHGSFFDRGYDCSGAVSFALRGGRFLQRPLSSGPLMSWGRAGRGRWLTVFSNPGHAFLVVAGWRFDTSGTGGKGPRWHRSMVSTQSFKARSWRGF